MIRALAVALLTLALVASCSAWNARQVARGDAQGAARVRAEWDAADARRQAEAERARAAALQERADAERAAREEDQRKQAQAERIAHETAQREAGLRADLARLQSRQRELLDAIARRDAAAAAGGDLSGAAAHPRAAAGADDATARQLLGVCGRRYSELGADAERLRLQVIGLQDYARAVAARSNDVSNDGF